MNKEFVPSSIALELKQLGFNEPCFGRWLIITEWEATTGEIRLQLGAEAESYDKNQCIAPTFSQAFRWFREKHRLSGLVEIGRHEYSFVIFNESQDSREITSSVNESYEKAELACLNKLIEIVKTK